MLKPFGILSPQLGTKINVPNILLKDGWNSESRNVIFQNGEIQRIKGRIQEFSVVLPDPINGTDQYWKDVTEEWWMMVATRRDICYWQHTNNRFVFLNKLYTEGKISVTKNSKIVTGSGTTWSTNTKAGDFIALKGSATLPTSDLTWYEIASVDSDTQLTLTNNYAGDNASDVDYYIRKTFTGENTDYWSVTTFNEKWIATNNGIDPIIVWDGIGQVEDLDCPYKAKNLISYENRLVLLYTIFQGTNYPMEVRWSGLLDETDWGGSASDAGAMACDEGVGYVVGAEILQGFLIIFKERAIIKAWCVVGDEVFNKKLVVDGIGTQAKGSIVATNKGIYFYCPDNTFRFFTGFSWEPISDEIDDIVKNLQPDYEENIQSIYSEEYSLILWAVPDANSEGKNNLVLVYDLDFVNDNWGIIEAEVNCFGSYLYEENLTWDTLPYNTWDEWDWEKWDTRKGLAGAPYDLAADYSGKMFRLFASEKDIGEDFSGYIVIETDCSKGKAENIYKRLQKIQAYVRKETAGVLNFKVKRDNEPEWQDIGSIDLTGDDEILVKELYPDIRGKHFTLKIGAENKFRLVGIILYSIDDGER